MWHQSWWLCSCLKAFKIRNDSIVVDYGVIVRERSLIWTLLSHNSTDVTESLISCHSLTIENIIQALVTVVRDTELSLALATTSRTSLIRIPSQHFECLFFVVRRLVVYNFIDLIVQRLIFAFDFGHLLSEILELCHSLAKHVLRLKKPLAEVSILFVAHVDGVDVVFILVTQVIQSLL